MENLSYRIFLYIWRKKILRAHQMRRLLMKMLPAQTKSNTIKNLHEFIEPCLEPLAKIALSSLPATTAKGYRILLHLHLSSNAADIPKTEDLLSLKRGPHTVMPCHISFANREDLNSCKNVGNRNLHHTKTVLEKLQNSKQIRDAESLLNMLSKHAVSPLLHPFSFVIIHPYVYL